MPHGGRSTASGVVCAEAVRAGALDAGDAFAPVLVDGVVFRAEARLWSPPDPPDPPDPPPHAARTAISSSMPSRAVTGARIFISPVLAPANYLSALASRVLASCSADGRSRRRAVPRLASVHGRRAGLSFRVIEIEELVEEVFGLLHEEVAVLNPGDVSGSVERL